MLKQGIIIQVMNAESRAVLPSSNVAALPSGRVKLEHLGVILAKGPDAAKFLQGQMTQDFVLLEEYGARLTAYCSAKGRMLASFIGFRHAPEEFLLLCSKDLLASTLKRLSMFVLRSKVALIDASDSWAIFGLSGNATLPSDGSLDKPWAKLQVGEKTYINLYPSVGVSRQVCVQPLSAPNAAADPLPLSLWAWGEVRSGVATITAPLVEQFVPQMLNFESVGGVSFKKGCYPGQEVVARSQFRGILKRRAYLAHSNCAMQPGDHVYGPEAELDSESEPAGTVVQAAPSPEGGFDAIVCLKVAAAGEGRLWHRLGGAEPIELLPLPYDLLDDI